MKDNEEIESLRQRVAELEALDQAITMNGCECGRGKRPSYDKCLVCAYQERGERMKAMYKWRAFYPITAQDIFDKWFDPETGEPL